MALFIDNLPVHGFLRGALGLHFSGAERRYYNLTKIWGLGGLWAFNGLRCRGL
jgi:hypothetical protein